MPCSSSPTLELTRPARSARVSVAPSIRATQLAVSLSVTARLWSILECRITSKAPDPTSARTRLVPGDNRLESPTDRGTKPPRSFSQTRARTQVRQSSRVEPTQSSRPLEGKTRSIRGVRTCPDGPPHRPLFLNSSNSRSRKAKSRSAATKVQFCAPRRGLVPPSSGPSLRLRRPRRSSQRTKSTPTRLRLCLQRRPSSSISPHQQQQTLLPPLFVQQQQQRPLVGPDRRPTHSTRLRSRQALSFSSPKARPPAPSSPPPTTTITAAWPPLDAALLPPRCPLPNSSSSSSPEEAGRPKSGPVPRARCPPCNGGKSGTVASASSKCSKR